jgi:hypothetical protein
MADRLRISPAPIKRKSESFGIDLIRQILHLKVPKKEFTLHPAFGIPEIYNSVTHSELAFIPFDVRTPDLAPADPRSERFIDVFARMEDCDAPGP